MPQIGVTTDPSPKPKLRQPSPRRGPPPPPSSQKQSSQPSPRSKANITRVGRNPSRQSSPARSNSNTRPVGLPPRPSAVAATAQPNEQIWDDPQESNNSPKPLITTTTIPHNVNNSFPYPTDSQPLIYHHNPNLHISLPTSTYPVVSSDSPPLQLNPAPPSPASFHALLSTLADQQPNFKTTGSSTSRSPSSLSINSQGLSSVPSRNSTPQLVESNITQNNVLHQERLPSPVSIHLPFMPPSPRYGNQPTPVPARAPSPTARAPSPPPIQPHTQRHPSPSIRTSSPRGPSPMRAPSPVYDYDAYVPALPPFYKQHPQQHHHHQHQLPPHSLNGPTSLHPSPFRQPTPPKRSNTPPPLPPHGHPHIIPVPCPPHVHHAVRSYSPARRPTGPMPLRVRPLPVEEKCYITKRLVEVCVEDDWRDYENTNKWKQTNYYDSEWDRRSEFSLPSEEDIVKQIIQAPIYQGHHNLLPSEDEIVRYTVEHPNENALILHDPNKQRISVHVPQKVHYDGNRIPKIEINLDLKWPDSMHPHVITVPVEKVVEVPVETTVERNVETIIEKQVEVPVEKLVERIVHVPFETIIEKPVEIYVEKRVEVPVVVEKLVEKVVEVPVDRIVEKIVQVPYEKIVEVPIEVVKYVEKYIQAPPQIVEKIVEKLVEVPVEVFREKVVEVPYERVVEKVVEVPVERIVERVVEVPVERVIERVVSPLANPREIHEAHHHPGSKSRSVTKEHIVETVLTRTSTYSPDETPNSLGSVELPPRIDTTTLITTEFHQHPPPKLALPTLHLPPITTDIPSQPSSNTSSPRQTARAWTGALSETSGKVKVVVEEATHLDLSGEAEEHKLRVVLILEESQQSTTWADPFPANKTGNRRSSRAAVKWGEPLWFTSVGGDTSSMEVTLLDQCKDIVSNLGSGKISVGNMPLKEGPLTVHVPLWDGQQPNQKGRLSGCVQLSLELAS